MSAFYQLRIWLVAVGLLHFLAPLRAAELARYMPNDTHLVVQIEVKQVIAAPLFQKNLQKQVEPLLKLEAVQTFLKDAGFDPLKDVDRVLFVMGDTCHRTATRNDGNGGTYTYSNSMPFLIVEGRFDAAKLQSLAEKLAKDHPRWLTPHKVGTATVWQLADPDNERENFFFALPDKNTLVITPGLDLATDVLDKAAGKKKTELKYKPMAELLGKLDPKHTIAWAACGDMIGDTHVNTVVQNGQSVTKIEYKLLKDKGINGFIGGLTVADDVKGTMSFTAKDAAKAKELADSMQAAMDLGVQQVENLAGQLKFLAPLVDAFKSIKFTAKDNLVAVQGQGSGPAIASLVQLIMSRGGAVPAEE